MLESLGGHHDCGQLRHTHSGYDTGRTDGTWTDSHLDGIDTAFFQRDSGLSCCYISGYDLQMGEFLTYSPKDS